jgi:hypothetical protein
MTKRIQLDPSVVNSEFTGVVVGAGITVYGEKYSAGECWIEVDETREADVLALQDIFHTDFPANSVSYPEGITQAMVDTAAAIVQAARAVPEAERTDTDTAIIVLDAGVRIPL